MYLLARKSTFTTRAVSEATQGLWKPITVDTLPEKLDFKQELPSASHVLLLIESLLHSAQQAGGSVLGQVEELEEQHATWL